MHDLIAHPHLRTRRMTVGGRTVEVPALPWRTAWEAEHFPPTPQIDEHGARGLGEDQAEAACQGSV